MAARLLALVAAVAMVVGALAVRDRMDDRTVARNETLRLVCSTELEQACQAIAGSADATIEVVVEPAGVTADAVAASATRGPDAWLVPAPYPEIVAGRRRADGAGRAFEKVADVGARSPVTFVAWRERAAVLAARCKGEITWRCVGDASGSAWDGLGGRPEWGPFKPYLPDGSREATGLLSLASAAVEVVGRADVAAIDLDEDAFLGWLGRVSRAIPPGAPAAGSIAVQEALTKGPAAYDVVAALEADAAPLVAVSARRSQLQVIYPAPLVTADIVVATNGPRGDRLAEIVRGDVGRRALAGSGWRVEGQQLATGIPVRTLEPVRHDAGLYAALRRRAAEVAR